MSKTIAFIGIDGSGKSTIVESLAEELKKRGRSCSCVYMGLSKEWAFPALGKIIGIYSHKKNKKESLSSEKSRRSNYRKRSFGWIAVQFFEFWARYIKFKFFSGKDYILFDRYFYDGLILSKGKGFSFWFFQKITPRPNLSYVVHASPKLIRERRDEASEDEISEFYSLVKKIQRSFKIKPLDNSGEVSVAAKEVLKDIQND